MRWPPARPPARMGSCGEVSACAGTVRHKTSRRAGPSIPHPRPASATEIWSWRTVNTKPHRVRVPMIAHLAALDTTRPLREDSWQWSLGPSSSPSSPPCSRFSGSSSTPQGRMRTFGSFAGDRSPESAPSLLRPGKKFGTGPKRAPARSAGSLLAACRRTGPSRRRTEPLERRRMLTQKKAAVLIRTSTAESGFACRFGRRGKGDICHR